MSPPRIKKENDDDDLSPPRLKKTLDGKKAGLQDAKSLKEELSQIKEKESSVAINYLSSGFMGFT